MSGYLKFDASYAPKQYLRWDDSVGKLRRSTEESATPISIINQRIQALLRCEEGIYDARTEKNFDKFLVASAQLFRPECNSHINIKDLSETNSHCLRINKLFPCMDPKPLSDFNDRCSACLKALKEELCDTVKQFLNLCAPTSTIPSPDERIKPRDQDKFLLFLHRCLDERRDDIINLAIKEALPKFVERCLQRCIKDGDDMLIPAILKKYSDKCMGFLGFFNLHFMDSLAQGNFKIISHFLDAGADINLQTYPQTPLHLVLRRRDRINNYLELVQFLLDRGANKNIRNAYGLTPLDLALSENLIDAVALLSISEE